MTNTQYEIIDALYFVTPFNELVAQLDLEKELLVNDIPYDRLIMEIERGPRILINDMDPNKPGQRAMGVNLIRNEGFEGIDWTDYGL